MIVWEASLTQPLAAYVQQYAEQMQAVVGNPSLSVVVVCNKTDVVPCPIPQLAGAPAARRAARHTALLPTPRRAAHSARRAAHPAPRVPRTHPRTLLALQSLATRSRSSQSVRSEARTCGTSSSCWSRT